VRRHAALQRVAAQADVAVFVGQHAREQRMQRMLLADQRAMALQYARGHLLRAQADGIGRHQPAVREVRRMPADQLLPARQLAAAEPVGPGCFLG
jgi:hypothetical protein